MHSQAKCIELALEEAVFDKEEDNMYINAHGTGTKLNDAAETITTVLALINGIVPPTINLDTPDPECELDYTPDTAVKTDLTIGISDSFGFGGHDACVAFRKYEE